MNHSGDAAEQIVRMSLEGVEVAARISGNAAKEIAVFLMAALKSPEKGSNGMKLKGKTRMTSMLKSGKALEIYSLKESDLKKFYQGAKQYGIVYCVLRNKKRSPDGLCDILVKADDAPKINRVAERFQFATVDKANVENIADPEINDTEKLLDDLLGTDEGKVEKEMIDSRPFRSESLKNSPSETIFGSKNSSEIATLNRFKTSVRDEFREIIADKHAKKDKNHSGEKGNHRKALKPKKSKGKQER